MERYFPLPFHHPQLPPVPTQALLVGQELPVKLPSLPLPARSFSWDPKSTTCPFPLPVPFGHMTLNFPSKVPFFTPFFFLRPKALKKQQVPGSQALCPRNFPPLINFPLESFS